MAVSAGAGLAGAGAAGGEGAGARGEAVGARATVEGEGGGVGAAAGGEDAWAGAAPGGKGAKAPAMIESLHHEAVNLAKNTPGRLALDCPHFMDLRDGGGAVAEAEAEAEAEHVAEAVRRIQRVQARAREEEEQGEEEEQQEEADRELTTAAAAAVDFSAAETAAAAAASFSAVHRVMAGEGTTHDLQEAAAGWRNAADHGDAGAQLLIGALYARGGGGVKKRLPLGKSYLQLSAAAGKEAAVTLLKELRKCLACGELDVHHMICSRCRKARYCDKGCQLRHWIADKHRLHCVRRRESADGAGGSSAGAYTRPLFSSM